MQAVDNNTMPKQVSRNFALFHAGRVGQARFLTYAEALKEKDETFGETAPEIFVKIVHLQNVKPELVLV